MSTKILLAIALFVGAQAEPPKTYTDEKYHYTLQYPGTFFFEKKKEGDGWFIFSQKRGTAVEFNANLNVTREDIAADAGVKTTADYAKFAREQVKKDVPTIVILQDPVEFKVGGKDFYKMVSFVEQNNYRLLVVQYFYYVPNFKSAFVWTAMDLTKHALKNVSALEGIIHTVKFQ